MRLPPSSSDLPLRHPSQFRRDAWDRDRSIGLAALLHLLLFAPLLVGHRIHAVAIRNPGTARGSRITLTYSPGRAPSQTSVAVLKPAPSPAQSRVKPTASSRAQLSTNAASPSSAHTDSAQGSNSLGSGNITVALATFFPWPRPELPLGTRGDVVVEITIDEQGKIVETRIASSMGESIDSLVLATIQTWTFKPATKDGVAIPSEQELLFHYERG